ncbi:telomere-associated protein RIF1 [Culicoides brevitarsis]|uniref:telomere-associated protein RIF1 n=1 Tax=Culicoides brevitarsis TaxID=469753 RepID=UPI00307BDEC5
MEDVNILLEEAVNNGLVSNIETLKKIVTKLSGVKASDTSTLSEKDINNWLSFFLPLVFNESPEIRAEVIRGLELLMPRLHQSPYQAYSVWQTVKKDIIETYTKRVKEMFNSNDPQWHVICNILLNILDSVIANSTVAINTFLPIIELAFRSENLKSRADAFLCWKEMIKIFVRYNQIGDPKRIKLICIPLKSSRSKTKEIAENKFDVWWTLIQALGDKLIEHTHLIESFVYFCVGPFGKQNEPLGSYLVEKNVHLASPGKIFDSIRDFSIVALAYMLGKPNRSIQRMAKQLKITYLENSSIVTEAIFDKIGNTLIAACIETTVLISKVSANQQELNDCIWSSLLSFITDKNAIKYRRFILDSLPLYKKLTNLMSAEYVAVLNQLVTSVIVACFSHTPLVNEAGSNEINEMVEICNLFVDEFKPKQISSLPIVIKARLKFETKAKATTNSPKLTNSAKKKEKEEFVAIPNIWKFNPATLTEHQREKMKERRTDIPSLYDGNSQSSQDTEVKPWNPKQIVIPGDTSNDTVVVLNDNSNSVTPTITKLSKKDSNSDENAKKPTGPSPRKALTRSSISPKVENSPKKQKIDETPTENSSETTQEVKEETKSPKENEVAKGAARRKAPPKQKKPKELQNLAIDTVEGKKLMEELQGKPDKKATRRTSIDRGAKRIEPTWKQSLIPPKKTRKGRASLDTQEEKKEEKDSTTAKKVLTQQNENKPQKSEKVQKLKDITEEETQKSTEGDEEEVIPNSQDPLKDQLERRRSRRESSFINKSAVSTPKEEKTEAEKKADATRSINFDEIPTRASTRNSPQIRSPMKMEKTPERPTSVQANLPPAKNLTPIKTPEKLVATPTVRCSPRKTENQPAAVVPHPIIVSAKSTSPTEGSTANGADLEVLRRSPRKVGEDQPVAAQMSPLKITVQDCLKQELASPTDRRKSPRKISPASPDHSSKETPSKLQKKAEEEDVDYQIDEPGSSDDNNEKDEEGTQTFLGEIVAPTSPTPDLDEKMDPIDKSMTIPSSPDQSFNDEKTSEFLNNTIDISPIASGKSSPVTRLAAKNANTESPASPEGRKVTRSTAVVQGIVNLDSPKTSNVMQGGRGAHMMSMVFKQSSTPVQQPTTSRSFSMAPPKNLQEARDILVFSKTLPAPDASPSASILKRKMEDSVDDIESPAYKRKRVSFHDPPVSLTKEYIRHEEEIRSPSIRPPINRCLLMAAVAQQKLQNTGNRRFTTSAVKTDASGSPVAQFRYTLKRKSKRESTNDLRKLELSQNTEQISSQSSSNSSTTSSLPVPQIPAEDANTTNDMSTLILNDHSTNGPAAMETSYEKPSEKDTSIRFGSKSEVLQYVMNTYQLEEILETYFEQKKTPNPKAVRIMARELSNQMETDSKLRYSILDRLSEKHASEFLEHAIQENPSKAICERLTLPVILNYVMEKAGNDAGTKLQILKKFESFVGGDEQTPSLLTKQELMTFILNCMPEELSNAETTLILDEIFGDKSPAEIYETMTTYFKKYLV